MINKKAVLAGLFFAGSLILASPPADAQEGVLLRVRAGDSNFCHLRFPAMQEHTVNWDDPQLKPASSGDIIDFYGPCNYEPTGEQAAERQQRVNLRLRMIAQE